MEEILNKIFLKLDLMDGEIQARNLNMATKSEIDALKAATRL